MTPKEQVGPVANSADNLERNGVIPGWPEVLGQFPAIADSSPKEKGYFQDFYRAQRRFAEGRPTKGKRVIDGLDKDPDFTGFEERNSTLLTEIARFVRGPSERHQRGRKGLKNAGGLNGKTSVRSPSGWQLPQS